MSDGTEAVVSTSAVRLVALCLTGSSINRAKSSRAALEEGQKQASFNKHGCHPIRLRGPSGASNTRSFGTITASGSSTPLYLKHSSSCYFVRGVC